MYKLKLIIPASLMLGAVLVCTTSSYGTTDIAKSTKKPCTFCHEKMVAGDKKAMNENLTAAGKYYKEKKTLDGYVAK